MKGSPNTALSFAVAEGKRSDLRGERRIFRPRSDPVRNALADKRRKVQSP